MTAKKFEKMTANELASALNLSIRPYRNSDGSEDGNKITVRAEKYGNGRERLAEFVQRTGLKVFRRKDKRVTEGGKNLLVFFHRKDFDKVTKVKAVKPVKKTAKKGNASKLCKEAIEKAIKMMGYEGLVRAMEDAGVSFDEFEVSNPFNAACEALADEDDDQENADRY